MRSRSRAAIGIWRARKVRAPGDRAYVIYAVFMVALVVVAPFARAVWLSATSPEGVALLVSPSAPGATVLVAASLWAGALLLGRDRGPALHPAFLTYALAASDLPRSDTFRGPLLRAGALVTAVTTTAAGLVACSVMSQGLAEPFSAAIFTGVAVLVGVIATVAWLAGQALPRAAVPIALSVFSLGLVTAAVPFMQPFTPWGWVGLAYPGTGTSHTVVPLAVIAAMFVALVPGLMNRLGFTVLAAQAARWDSATAHAMGVDFSMAAALYRGRPYTGRQIRAVRPVGRLVWTFLARDAIGAARTPGRLVVALVALITGSILMTLAFVPASPGWLLGASSGLVMFAGLGPLTDGVRHAASVAGGFPLYGIRDENLLANHMLFPLAIVALVLLTSVIVCSLSISVPPAAPLVGSLALGLLAVFNRVGHALKGPVPPSLLTPIPSPMGDLSPAFAVTWALDGVLLAALAGASAALAFQTPSLLVVVAAAVLGVGINRWHHRGS